ncbi:hypothetical protein EIP86_005730 [Pleurotus ostreatoroseus]|nr:hypothetical protein EIP86_005730 [Pleurotus ostreatoroseus]
MAAGVRQIHEKRPGTPIPRLGKEFREDSQLRFLGLTFDELNKQNRCQQFADMKQCLLKETPSSHPERFMDILQRTCIHRTEKTPSGQIRVDLPVKRVFDEPVALWEDERRLYDLVNQIFMREKVFPRLMRQRQGNSPVDPSAL